MGQAVSRRAEAIAPRAGELVGGPRVLQSLQALSSLPVLGRERGPRRGQRAWQGPTAAGCTWAILCTLPGREGAVSKGNKRADRHGAADGRGVLGPGKRGNARGGQAPGPHRPGRGPVVSPPAAHATPATPRTRSARLSARAPPQTCHSLRPHGQAPSRTEGCQQLDGAHAVGVAGVTQAAAARDVADTLTELVARRPWRASRPGPGRPGLRPTAGPPKATRPWGISHREAQVVQRLRPRGVASSEAPRCLACASGCRPGRGCPAARRAWPQPLARPEVETSRAVESANSGGTRAHGLLAARRRAQVQDARLRRERQRRCQAGGRTAGAWSVSEAGVPPGRGGSP